jgi:glycosyltransferase involved in cell wall biosynthesis
MTRLNTETVGVRLSVVIITHNEEANIRRTLESVQPLVCDGQGEIVVVDSGSTDRTVEIARELGAKVFVEPWKGFAAQKNSAIEKATGEWVLSLDADEWLEPALINSIEQAFNNHAFTGFYLRRKNYFLNRWMKHGGFAEKKLRLFKRESGRFKDVPVHEVIEVNGRTGFIRDGAIRHDQYPTLDSYIEHMNRYSSLGAEIAVNKGHRSFSFVNIVLRPVATFVQKYFLKLGFLDGREGLLLCFYHSVYVSWKYAKAWEKTKLSIDE